MGRDTTFGVLTGLVFVIAVVGLGLSSATAFEPLPPIDVPSNAIPTNGSVPMTAMLKTRNVVPTENLEYNLGAQDTPFYALHTTSINGESLSTLMTQETSITLNRLVIAGENNTIVDSGVLNSSLTMGALLSQSGITPMVGDIDMGNKNLLNVSKISGFNIDEILIDPLHTILGGILTFGASREVEDAGFLQDTIVTCANDPVANSILQFASDRAVKPSSVDGRQLVNGVGSTTVNTFVTYDTNNALKTNPTTLASIGRYSNYIPLSGGSVNGNLSFTARVLSAPSRFSQYANNSLTMTLDSIPAYIPLNTFTGLSISKTIPLVLDEATGTFNYPANQPNQYVTVYFQFNPLFSSGTFSCRIQIVFSSSESVLNAQSPVVAMSNISSRPVTVQRSGLLDTGAIIGVRISGPIGQSLTLYGASLVITNTK